MMKRSPKRERKRLTFAACVVPISVPCELRRTCENSPPNRKYRRKKHCAQEWNRKRRNLTKPARRFIRRSECPGSARASRAGDGALAAAGLISQSQTADH